VLLVYPLRFLIDRWSMKSLHERAVLPKNTLSYQREAMIKSDLYSFSTLLNSSLFNSFEQLICKKRLP